MAGASTTFSESWYRVANLKASLIPTVTMRKQLFRGETWYVLSDPFNNQFFRLRPEAHDFVSRLHPQRTVEEVWTECLDRYPDAAPGQEDVIQLLTQLYQANLLYSEMPADSQKLFERYSKRRQREVRSKLLSIMFIRIPLIDPQNFLKRVNPFTKHFVSPIAALIWLLVVLAAGKIVIDRFDAVYQQVQGILAPDNLVLLYIGMILVKTLHEFGHAVVCSRFGGEVHTMGVMLLIFTPLPYMDATSSWSFRSRWHRALVGAAGMIVEIFIAALAVFLWARTGPGTLHSLAYNMMFIASVSTLLFNGNPLLRFDGYYILSDLMDIPNLSSNSLKHLRHLTERYLFGYKESVSPAHTRKEAVWLTIFGILSGIYRIIIFTGIILFVADKFLLAGLIMATICVFSWGIRPVIRLISYLVSSPRLARTRLRATSVVVGLFVVLTSFLAIWPFPNRFRAPGVVEAVHHLQMVNDVSGTVEQLFVPSGTMVLKDTPLMKLSSKELELEIRVAIAQREETLALKMLAASQSKADLEPIVKRMASIESRLQDLYEQDRTLVVRAKRSGLWVSPRSHEWVGAWIMRGTSIGEIIPQGDFRFSAIVSQDEASNLFVDRIERGEVRLYGQGGVNLEVRQFQIIPFQHEELPSAALGWYGGGDVAVSVSDQTGLKAAEPFFQIYAELGSVPGAALFHGQSGKLRFSMPPKPLLMQWGRKIRQLLHKRYQI